MSSASKGADQGPLGEDSAERPAARTASGKQARKPFLLRLSPELMGELRAWANHDLRSLNGHIEYLLREALRRRRGNGSDSKDRDGSR